MVAEQSELDDAILNADLRYKVTWTDLHDYRHAYLEALEVYENYWE